MKQTLFLLLLMIGLSVSAQDIKPRISVHDPVMIKQDSMYYIFCTGRGIAVWSSKNRVDWVREKPVFTQTPAWASQAIPKAKPNDFWAPDISYYKGTYYLFYAVSVFGKNTSVIGLATNKTLNINSPDFKWEDQGMVIQSFPGQDRFNAIDANLIRDEKGTPWLSFGSFWDGIKLVKLSADLKTTAEPRPWPTIAGRPRNKTLPDSVAGNGAIEAPFIFKKDEYYYLFTSWDYCCRGPKSTYKMMVGRSKNIKGPYLDRIGSDLAKGGGTLVLAGDKEWYGVGHNAVCTFDGIDYIIFHAYDAADNGRSKLRVEQLGWDSDGWPVVELKHN
ncbi:arabinan endo-1,5-alpha-L-arabinosidase [Mucilaginibacter sp. HMF5004]|uniref:arabinan endo-1,5-alpha-L-arabinosidase n=1 Tax=Mucilaginibacter rivuli TaxID=2857527 RepID=UPI001C5F9C0D|nr:arabinan endo-1,5-alpha-L-arabinosidase [Mucilaginibacter rivuli]MBW4890366.1 arabinan endo-1,5-alpha-L-arabinosidase [Mucilaginibacter rivuli]